MITEAKYGEIGWRWLEIFRTSILHIVVALEWGKAGWKDAKCERDD